MKKIYFLSISGLLYSLDVLAQRRGGSRSYEITGLADGDSVAQSIMIGVPIILIGFLIAYFTMWNKKSQEKEETSSVGCFGVIIMAIGFFIMLPLLGWIEFIFASITSTVIFFIIIGILIFGISQLFKKS